MALDLTSFIFPNMRENAARAQGRRAEQNAVRSASAAAQTRGAVNPAAMARLNAQTQAEQRAANAANIANAQAQDQAAMGQAITGAIGTGLNMLGGVGGMLSTMGGTAAETAAQMAQPQQVQAPLKGLDKSQMGSSLQSPSQSPQTAPQAPQQAAPQQMPPVTPARPAGPTPTTQSGAYQGPQFNPQLPPPNSPAPSPVQEGATLQERPLSTPMSSTAPGLNPTGEPTVDDNIAILRGIRQRNNLQPLAPEQPPAPAPIPQQAPPAPVYNGPDRELGVLDERERRINALANPLAASIGR